MCFMCVFVLGWGVEGGVLGIIFELVGKFFRDLSLVFIEFMFYLVC